MPAHRQPSTPRRLLRHLLRGLLDTLFPPRCVLCGTEAVSPGAIHHGEPFQDLPASLCRACHHALPRPGPACPVCALPTPSGETCGACLRTPPPFDATLVACRYAFPVDRLLQDFKYRHSLALAEPLAHRLAEAFYETPPASAPDCLIAMPLSAARQSARGFNQAQEIARPLSHLLSLPLRNDALIRSLDTPQQATLPMNDRHKNVRHAFALAESARPQPLDGLRVALIDDVMTTGATAAAASRVLRSAGAAHIALWVVARAMPHDGNIFSY